MQECRHSEEEVAFSPGAPLGVGGAGQCARGAERRAVVVCAASSSGTAVVRTSRNPPWAIRADWPKEREDKAWLMSREMQRRVNVRDYLQWQFRGNAQVLPKIRGRLQRAQAVTANRPYRMPLPSSGY